MHAIVQLQGMMRFPRALIVNRWKAVTQFAVLGGGYELVLAGALPVVDAHAIDISVSAQVLLQYLKSLWDDSKASQLHAKRSSLSHPNKASRCLEAFSATSLVLRASPDGEHELSTGACLSLCLVSARTCAGIQAVCMLHLSLTCPMHTGSLCTAAPMPGNLARFRSVWSASCSLDESLVWHHGLLVPLVCIAAAYAGVACSPVSCIT